MHFVEVMVAKKTSRKRPGMWIMKPVVEAWHVNHTIVTAKGTLNEHWKWLNKKNKWKLKKTFCPRFTEYPCHCRDRTPTLQATITTSRCCPHPQKRLSTPQTTLYQMHLIKKHCISTCCCHGYVMAYNSAQLVKGPPPPEKNINGMWRITTSAGGVQKEKPFLTLRHKTSRLLNKQKKKNDYLARYVFWLVSNRTPLGYFKEEGKSRALEEWQNSPPEMCATLASSMPGRIESVIKNIGGHTMYWKK